MMDSESGILDVVQALLAKGAEVNAKANDGKTALIVARTPEIEALLVRAGAKA
jgi:ankyrin repeat protein